MADNGNKFCYISSILFTDKDYQPLVFCIRPSATRARLKILIECGGGKVTSRLDPSDTNVIKILADGDEHSSPDYLLPSYVDDCVAANSLLDKYSYRVPLPTEDQSTVVSDVTAKGRSYYSSAEDEAILEYIAKHPFQYSGNKIWKRMELMKITNHSWQSMRDHFLKKLEGRLQKYTKKREKNVMKKYVLSEDTSKLNDEEDERERVLSSDKDTVEETTSNSVPMLTEQKRRGNSDPKLTNKNTAENEHSDASSFDMDLFEAANEDLKRKSSDENQRVQKDPPILQDHIVRRSVRHSQKQTQDSAKILSREFAYTTRSKRAEMQDKYEVQNDKKIDTRRKIGKKNKLNNPEADIAVNKSQRKKVIRTQRRMGEKNEMNMNDIGEQNGIIDDNMNDIGEQSGTIDDNIQTAKEHISSMQVDGIDNIDIKQSDKHDDIDQIDGVDDEGNQIDGVDDECNLIDGVDDGIQLDGNDDGKQTDEVEDDVLQIDRVDGHEETVVQQRNTMVTTKEIIDGIGNDSMQPEELDSNTDENKSIRSRKRNMSSPQELTVVHLLSTKKRKTPVKTPSKLDTTESNEHHVEESSKRTFSRGLRRGLEMVSDSSASDDTTSDVLPMKRTRYTSGIHKDTNTELDQASEQASEQASDQPSGTQGEEQTADYIKLIEELCTKYRQTKLEICTALYVCSGDFTRAEKYLENGSQPDIRMWSSSQDRLLLSSSSGQDISSNYSRAEASQRLLWLQS